MPPVATVSDLLADLAEVHDHVVRETWTQPPAAARAGHADVAHARTTTAFALASVLTARASLFAAPALVASAQIECRPQAATTEELANFRTALGHSAAALLEAARVLGTVARTLGGPEPKVLRDLNARPAGTKAASTARSRARPSAILSVGVQPAAQAAAARRTR
ncbi:hypothetical protein [Kitasatospora sp. NPDC057015]|uniref:hypothetical protein n=1 Tax=Kitasatospora sp. NPDC057015 TaxID=3346001 RepID=UPI00362E33DB